MRLSKALLFLLPVMLLIISSPATYAALSDGLREYYDGDMATCVGNRINLTANLTANGGANCATTGRIGQGYNMSSSNTKNFNGTNGGAPVLAQARTLCYWLNTTSVTSFHHIVNYGASGVSGTCYGHYTDTTTPTFYGFGSDQAFTSSVVAVNTWEYICTAYNGSAIMNYYNGVNVNNATKALSTNQTPIHIGTDCQTAGTNLGTGVVDEIGIWNRTLTSAEITSLYNGGAGCAYDGCIVPVTATSPFMNSISESISADNLTLIITASANSTNNATVRYNTTINRSGTLEYLNYSDFVTANTSVQYVNYTITQAGNYSVCANPDDVTATNATTLCTAFQEVTFPANPAPVVQSVSFSVSSNNRTLLISANATDVNNATVRYNTTINRSGTIEYLNYSGFVTSNLTLQYVNFTVTQPGNYSACVFANDGANTSVAAKCTAFQEVTLPVNTPPTMQSLSITASADNLTIIVTGNATDPNDATIRFNTSLNTSGSTSDIGFSALVPSGISRQYLNISVNTSGNYSVCANADDTQNSSVNFVCTDYLEITFPVSIPPSMSAITASLSSDNTTFLLFGNATDPDNATVRYNTSVNKSGVVQYLNYSGFVTSGVLKNYANYSVPGNGNYSFCANPNDGVTSNMSQLCTAFQEVTFPVNTPPTMRAVSFTITANNGSLIMKANATDTTNLSIRYNTTVNRSGVLTYLGLSGPYAAGTLLNYRNYTVPGTGNYSVCANANDGINNSATLCTAFQEVTVPVTPPASINGAISVIILALVLALLIGVLAALISPSEEIQRIALYATVAITAVAVMIAVLMLLV